jgi:HSP20 family protein
MDQKLPVNVYETTGGLMVVAPMPGIEAEDIAITITGEHLTIQGRMRGPRQEERTYLQHEWHYGPYSRTLPLPFPVRAAQANASLGNGVLTVSLLRAAEPGPGPITLHHSGQARGQAIGHSGQTGRP